MPLRRLSVALLVVPLVAVAGSALLAGCASGDSGTPSPAPALPAETGASLTTGRGRMAEAMQDQATPGALAAAQAAMPAMAAVEEQLDLALLQRSTPELWEDLQDTVALGQKAIASAAAAAGPDPKALVMHLEAATATLGAVTADPDAAFAALRAVEGRLPQTSELLVARLFEEGRPAEASAALTSAFAHWPNRAPLHQLARAWRDAIPDATPLLATLDAAPAVTSASTGGPVGEARALATATRGYLLLSRGIALQAAEDPSAAEVYERGATELARVESDPLADAWELAQRRGDCLINAGWLHLAAARTALAAGGLASARPELEAAERDFSAALDAVPDDPDAVNGINLTGDMYYEGGSPEGIREFFGRMARAHDRAEWWNNFAFFCRETEQYEDSYAAYEHCIGLAPDNARWVNDTGLILLYHLQRDLDHAEELFRRSIALGKDACANPFIEPDRYEENFSAYTDAMLNLSKLKLEQGDLATARSVCDELLALAPNRPDARQLDVALRAAGTGSKEP